MARGGTLLSRINAVKNLAAPISGLGCANRSPSHHIKPVAYSLSVQRHQESLLIAA
jgi:hypothetical protein